jgi:hypothetical protein
MIIIKIAFGNSQEMTSNKFESWPYFQVLFLGQKLGQTNSLIIQDLIENVPLILRCLIIRGKCLNNAC